MAEVKQDKNFLYFGCDPKNSKDCCLKYCPHCIWNDFSKNNYDIIPRNYKGPKPALLASTTNFNIYDMCLKVRYTINFVLKRHKIDFEGLSDLIEEVGEYAIKNFSLYNYEISHNSNFNIYNGTKEHIHILLTINPGNGGRKHFNNKYGTIQGYPRAAIPMIFKDKLKELEKIDPDDLKNYQSNLRDVLNKLFYDKYEKSEKLFQLLSSEIFIIHGNGLEFRKPSIEQLGNTAEEMINPVRLLWSDTDINIKSNNILNKPYNQYIKENLNLFKKYINYIDFYFKEYKNETHNFKHYLIHIPDKIEFLRKNCQDTFSPEEKLKYFSCYISNIEEVLKTALKEIGKKVDVPKIYGFEYPFNFDVSEPLPQLNIERERDEYMMGSMEDLMGDKKKMESPRYDEDEFQMESPRYDEDEEMKE